MKFYHILMISGLLAGMTAACKPHEKDELAHDHAHEQQAAEAHEHRPGEIVLEAEMAARLGVEADTVSYAPTGNALKVSGVVEAAAGSTGAVSAPAAGILTLARGITEGAQVRAGELIGTVRSTGVSGGDRNRAARVELEAARAELERVTPLWEERLVTRSQYNAAVAAYERAQAAYSAPAASGRITAPVGGVITSLEALNGQYVETGAVVATIGNSASLTLRADVPARNSDVIGSVKDARIVLPYSGEQLLLSDLGGRRAGASASASRPGYVPVTFTFAGHEGLLPGTAVEVYLLGGDSHEAIAVPVDALVEQQGNFYVYHKLDDDCYEKLPVKTGRSDGSRVEILSGLAGGECIVTRGATVITLAAASGNIPEGHSHQH